MFCGSSKLLVKINKHPSRDFEASLPARIQRSICYLADVGNKLSSFPFNDTRIVEEQFLEIVNILRTREVAIVCTKPTYSRMEKVNEMAVELTATQQQVQRSTAECEGYLLSIVSQRRDVDETQKLGEIGEDSRRVQGLQEARGD
ncbi:hypothetical protein TSAR_009864 [Trichomalopsis sarcophagae]|uniref:Uncharacterized protein n=1 Tax=Trichomalopsis sarcophagae TaxID=543379 RepID=A0A232FJH0_9HYME|nr:hypothetical protein TSAR_009864 [Trichomalopsis sarcophagae]